MWRIIFIIPNIDLGKSIENEYIGIVPHNDERVIEITENNPSLKSLVNGFEDQFKNKICPTILIVNDDAHEFVLESDVIVGFRNIFAIATIIRNHIFYLDVGGGNYIKYSDYFDFYPISPVKTKNGYIINTPAETVHVFDSEKYFRGQSRPGLPIALQSRCEPDQDLFELLEKMWRERYIKRKFDWETSTLFRSLEMAYQATTMPIKNYSGIYDFGVSVSMWVSAFEILSHPLNKNASLETVIDLLGKYNWYNKEIKRKQYYLRYRKKPKINLVQKLYNELYNARNDFLHGNDVSQQRLFPFKNTNLCPLNAFAPLLYKVALHSYLEKPREALSFEEKFLYIYNQSDLVKGILKSKKNRSLQGR